MGIFDISSVFMKILSTGYLTLVLLAIFLALNEYNLILLENTLERESLVIGNAILSSCIAETSGDYYVKGLLSEDKINGPSPLSCLSYDKKIYVKIYDENKNLLHGIGDSGALSDPIVNAIFPAALNRTSGIIPVTLELFVGV